MSFKSEYARETTGFRIHTHMYVHTHTQRKGEREKMKSLAFQRWPLLTSLVTSFPKGNHYFNVSNQILYFLVFNFI